MGLWIGNSTVLLDMSYDQLYSTLWYLRQIGSNLDFKSLAREDNGRLQHLQGIPNPEFQRSLLSSDWAVLGTELLKYGISQDLIDEEFFFIQNLLEEIIGEKRKKY